MVAHRLVSALACATAPILALAASVSVREVAKFPVGAWIENLAQRPSGQLLITRFDTPELWSVDPISGHTDLVTSIPDVTSLLGIAEIAPDVYAIAVGNVTATTVVPDSFSVRSVDLSKPGTPKVAKIADVPQAGFLNGAVASPDGKSLLVADSIVGVVFSIDLSSGVVSTALSGPEYEGPATLPLGVNGVHIASPHAYFTNSGNGTFCRVRIHPDGTAAGAVEQLVDSLEVPDDFALSTETGGAYIAVGATKSVVYVSAAGVRTQVAGGSNSTIFAKPTAARFGRTLVDRQTLYVTTTGDRETGVATSDALVLALTFNEVNNVSFVE